MAKVREENLAELAQEIGAASAVQLQRIARGLHRLHEIECERELTDKEQRRYERLGLEAMHLADQLRRSLYLQTDPRGWPIYIARNGHRLTDSDYNQNSIAVCPH